MTCISMTHSTKKNLWNIKCRKTARYKTGYWTCICVELWGMIHESTTAPSVVSITTVHLACLKTSKTWHHTLGITSTIIWVNTKELCPSIQYTRDQPSPVTPKPSRAKYLKTVGTLWTSKSMEYLVVSASSKSSLIPEAWYQALALICITTRNYNPSNNSLDKEDSPKDAYE